MPRRQRSPLKPLRIATRRTRRLPVPETPERVSTRGLVSLATNRAHCDNEHESASPREAQAVRWYEYEGVSARQARAAPWYA